MFINIFAFLRRMKRVAHNAEEVRLLRVQLKQAFDKIKFQFEEHLEAINENTNEIQANYNLLKDLEERIEHLRGQLEAVQMQLSHLDPSFAFKKGDMPFEIQPLAINEKRVLVVLLASQRFLSYGELAKMLNMSQSLVRSYVTNMIAKGIPIVKKYLSGKPTVNVDEKFKDVQEKHDIARLAQRRLNSF